jgi:hypothetical protein
MKDHIKKFIPIAAKELGLLTLPKIHLVGHEEDTKDAFGHSKGHDITVRTVDRHPVDVMRTLAHELIHYKQNITGSKKGEQMREDQANAIAGRIMRKFDTIHPNEFKDKPIPEEVASNIPNNCMGASSSTQGTGGIATIDPLMGKRNKKGANMLSRQVDNMKKLSDIIGSNSTLKKLNTKFKRTQ